AIASARWPSSPARDPLPPGAAGWEDVSRAVRCGRASLAVRALARGLWRDGPGLDPAAPHSRFLVHFRGEGRVPASHRQVPRPPLRVLAGMGAAGAAAIRRDPGPA